MTKLSNTIALVALASTIYSAEKQDTLDSGLYLGLSAGVSNLGGIHKEEIKYASYYYSSSSTIEKTLNSISHNFGAFLGCRYVRNKFYSAL